MIAEVNTDPVLEGFPKDRNYKELGMWNNENTTLALGSLTPAPFTRAPGLSKDVTIFLASVRKGLNNAKIHVCWPICSIYGRKPDVASDLGCDLDSPGSGLYGDVL